jgi:A/G-specific adenine glycosylase
MTYSEILCYWFEANKRDMPWRQTKDPYKIWVSEIMLQQTQVDTVIPYYLRFIERFPDINTLAGASLEEVFALWQGLGYYRRAEYLHRGAQMIVNRHGGVFPRNRLEASKIPGIGAYTLGAVFSMAFNEPLPAVDGNVMRVLSRHFMIDADIANPSARAGLRNLPYSTWGRIREPSSGHDGAWRTRVHTQKSPMLPVSHEQHVQAFKADKALDYPKKSKKPRPQVQIYRALILKWQNAVWMEKRPQDGLLAGLWGFPLINEAQWDKWMTKPKAVKDLKPVQHVFTSFKVAIDACYP